MSEKPAGFSEESRPPQADEGARPGPPERTRKRLRTWFLRFLITFFVLNALSLVLGHETRAKLEAWNEAMVQGVENMDPFLVAKDYWRYVAYDDRSFMSPKGSEPSPSFPRLEPEKSSLRKALDFAVRAILGVLLVPAYVALSGGPVSIALTLVALVLALLIVTDLGQDLGLLQWVLIPFIASLVTFALILLVRLVGLALGGVFVAAQGIAAIEGTLFGMIWKVGEHEVVGKLIHKLTRKVH